MGRVTVQIEFANPNYKVVECLNDLNVAVESASHNLRQKHNVILYQPRVVEGRLVVMDVDVPNEIENTFSIGNHLRGISAYLMKYCEGRYNEAVVGRRLLKYTNLAVVQDETNTITSYEKLQLLGDISRLMQVDDTVANDKIRRIKDIVEE